MKKIPVLLVPLMLLPLLLFPQKEIKAPVAKVKPVSCTLHDEALTDPYAWMKNKNSRAMKKYLVAENKYALKKMMDARPLVEMLFDELNERLEDTIISVPYRKNGYLYYYRYDLNASYPAYYRKKNTDSPEEMLFNVTDVVKKEKCYGAYFSDVSPDNRIMSYAIDKTGNFSLTYSFMELSTRKKLEDALHRVSSIEWAADSKTIFYTVEEKNTNRSYRLYRHVLGTPAAQDELLYEEKDKQFDIYLYVSKTRSYIYLIASSFNESEVYYLPADQPSGTFRLIYPREKNHEYYVTDAADKFYIITNKDAVNYRAVTVNTDNPAAENWQEIIPHREDVLLDDISIFKNHLVISERSGGNKKIRIRQLASGEEKELEFGEAVYSLSTGVNHEYDTEWLRVNFSSLKSPLAEYDIDMNTQEKILLKQEVIPCGHNPDDYVTEKTWATGADGKKIPVSLLYRKGLEKNGNNPVYIEGYGAYGMSYPTEYNNFIYLLVNRGFIYAIAHVRGGDELGRNWYLDGKMMNKKNSFTDFIACTEHLIEAGYTSAGNIVAQGASAGGLLVGAVLNMRPDLYKGVILHVPFVDPLYTMLDTLLPLTTQEFNEWGNPYEKPYFDYIKSYSPYENLKTMRYPHLLFTSGIADEQVGIWEPAKMVAKLRALKTDDNLLIFKINFKGGHGGASGLFGYYYDTAYEYAWVLKIFGMDEM